MLNLTNAQKTIVSQAQIVLQNQYNGRIRLPEKGRIPLKDKILYALRDLDWYEQGFQGLRHKSVDHVFKALKRYLKEAAQ